MKRAQLTTRHQDSRHRTRTDGRRTRTAATLAGAAAMLVLAACSSNSDDDSGSSTAANDPTESPSAKAKDPASETARVAERPHTDHDHRR